MDFAQIWVILKLSLRPKGIKCRNISAVTVSAVITAVITAVNLTVAHYVEQRSPSSQRALKQEKEEQEDIAI